MKNFPKIDIVYNSFDDSMYIYADGKLKLADSIISLHTFLQGMGIEYKSHTVDIDTDDQDMPPTMDLLQ